MAFDFPEVTITRSGRPVFGAGLLLAGLSNALIIGGDLLVLGLRFRWQRGVAGLGFGDVKLAAVWATSLSLSAAIDAITFAAIAALAAVLVFRRVFGHCERQERVLFGVDLAPAFWIVWLMARS